MIEYSGGKNGKTRIKRTYFLDYYFEGIFFPEEEMKEQEAFYIEYLADPEQKEVELYCPEDREDHGNDSGTGYHGQ